MPIGVRIPVESMSSRPLMGMVQALEMPGSRSAASISARSSASLIRSSQMGRSTGFSHAGAQEEYQRGFSRHADRGFSVTVVSIIESGAGAGGGGRGPAGLPEHPLDLGEGAEELAL